MKNKNTVDPILIRRLQEADCPMPEDCEDERMPCLVAVVSGPEITRAYVMRGWAEYVVALRITNHSYDCLEVQKFECDSYWPIRLIGGISGNEKPAYRLPGSGRTFLYESVLNHRTGRAGRINPGDSMEGILLAFRRQLFPEECLVRPVIPMDLSIVDQDGRHHVSEIEVTVDRTAIINPMTPRGNRTGLFGPARPETRGQVRAIQEQGGSPISPSRIVVSANKPTEASPHLTSHESRWTNGLQREGLRSRVQ